MTSADDDSSDTRARLTQRANLVRTRMLRRIDLLAERRQALSRTITGVRAEVRRVLPAAAGVAVLVSAGLVVLLRARARRQRRHRGWVLPAQHAQRAEAGFVERTLRGLALSLAARLLQSAAKLALRRYLPAQASPPALPARPPAPVTGGAGI